MAASLWNPCPWPIFTQAGDMAARAKAYFYVAGTSQPLQTYSDSGLSVPNSLPIVANSAGVFSPIYLPYTDYRVRVLDANNVLIYDADGIANPAPASGGGGGGIVVDATEIFTTGDTKWRFDSNPISGFVRLNGRTIGSAISGATERPNSDTEDLFNYLWNTLSDSIAPVSTGRGVSASADWAANKTITLPSMRGRVPVGTDTMGGSAANIVQISTTADVENGSATVEVASSTGLARGMTAIIDGNSSGTITAISGTTVTLSTPWAGTTDTGLSLRASFFTDAQTPGSAGGSQTIIQTAAELATHSHTYTDDGHQHRMNQSALYGLGFGNAVTGAGSNIEGSISTIDITIDDAGQGLPTQIIQPSRAVTWFVKL